MILTITDILPLSSNFGKGPSHLERYLLYHSLLEVLFESNGVVRSYDKKDDQW